VPPITVSAPISEPPHSPVSDWARAHTTCPTGPRRARPPALGHGQLPSAIRDPSPFPPPFLCLHVAIDRTPFPLFSPRHRPFIMAGVAPRAPLFFPPSTPLPPPLCHAAPLALSQPPIHPGREASPESPKITASTTFFPLLDELRAQALFTLICGPASPPYPPLELQDHAGEARHHRCVAAVKERRCSRAAHRRVDAKVAR
jgi:hypothetical protein